MQDILLSFHDFLNKTKKILNSTCNAYKQDIKEFINFINSKPKSLKNITQKDFSDFINLVLKPKLINKKLINKSINRKLYSLKAFAIYLHKQYNLPDYSRLILIKLNNKLNNSLNNKIISCSKNLNYKELRDFIIFYFISHLKIPVSKIVNLSINDLNKDLNYNYLLISFKDNKYKKINLKPEFINLLKNYIKQLSLKLNKPQYLFPVKLANTIKPISIQAAHAIYKLYKQNASNINYNSLFTNSNFELDSDILDLYKKAHPRY